MKRKKKPTTELDKIYNRAKRNFNKFVQLRDCEIIGGQIFAVCYTCKRKKAINCTYDFKEFHAGHAWKDVYYSSVEFETKAVKGQCYQCNVRKSGNESIYQENLRNELGNKEYDKLLLQKNQIKKWTYTELEEINKESLRLIKEQKLRLNLT